MQGSEDNNPHDTRQDESSNPGETATTPLPRLPAHNPYIGTLYHGMLFPPLHTYSYYALHSPHVPFLRHAAPTAPICKIIHDMMAAEQTKREQCGEDDWVFVEKE